MDTAVKPTLSATSVAPASSLLARDIAVEISESVKLFPAPHPTVLMEHSRLREAIIESMKPSGGLVATGAREMQAQAQVKVTPEQATQAAGQLLARRAADQAAMLQLLTSDARFHSEKGVAELAALPEPDKLPEFVEMLVQPNKAGGPEPMVHIIGHAEGEDRLHRVLAECWKPGGAVHQQLKAELRAALPDVRPSVVDLAADHFINRRHTMAMLAVHAMQPDSRVVSAAMELSRKASPIEPPTLHA